MRKEKVNKSNKSKLKLVLKMISLIVAGIILIPIIILFAIRIVNSIRFRLSDGVQEKIYVPLGDVEQFINIRGTNVENPVVIWLHGGPGGPDTFFTTTYQQELETNYTFIRWDQRGCGRTYYKNKTAPISWDILLADLNDLVDYAAARFNQPVIIVGHSWGSVLGSTYAAAHPEKIAGYVGVGQATDLRKSEQIAAETAIEMARTAGNELDAVKIAELYQSYTSTGLSSENSDGSAFLQLTQLRQLTAGYLSPNNKVSISYILTALTSPDYGWNDLRWQLRVMTHAELVESLNRPLFAVVENFDLPYSFDIPVMFIQGENDYACSTALAKEYQKSLSAPISDIFIMPGLGHAPMIEDSAEFAKILKKALDLIV